jgi:hypothetical protein
MHDVIADAWRIYQNTAHQSIVVQPTIPILFFGDSERYFRSQRRVITVGLNPSRAEFPDPDRLSRFPAARVLTPTAQDSASDVIYLRALNGYYRTDPYRGWFNAFEPLLQGLGCSYYDGSANTALHTDLCSPLATDPTWSRLSDTQRAALSGTVVYVLKTPN